PKSQTPKLARHLLSLCRQYRFDPAFVLSLIQVESAFKIKARSPVGALGLMQLMPGTAQFIAQELGIEVSQQGITERALLDPFFNITLGVAYLAWLRDHYAGSAPYYLVAAYNIGPARLDELLSRKSFKPVGTKKYFQAIRRGIPEFRYYRHPVAQDELGSPGV
ncbi:MAG: lytic transglycosylase domain-containing protein, partial [Bdellovibrionota bacterium]